MWKCSCNANNYTFNMLCKNCNKLIPIAEEKRIYREQLQEARDVLGIDYEGDVNAVLQGIFHDKDVTIRNLRRYIWQRIKKGVKENKRPVAVAAIVIMFLVSMSRLNSIETRMKWDMCKARYGTKREQLSYQIDAKQEKLKSSVRYYRDTGEAKYTEAFNAQLPELKVKFDTTKAAVKEKYDKAMAEILTYFELNELNGINEQNGLEDFFKNNGTPEQNEKFDMKKLLEEMNK